MIGGMWQKGDEITKQADPKVGWPKTVANESYRNLILSYPSVESDE